MLQNMTPNNLRGDTCSLIGLSTVLFFDGLRYFTHSFFCLMWLRHLPDCRFSVRNKRFLSLIYQKRVKLMPDIDTMTRDDALQYLDIT